ncbi:MAG TPA: hypothetical protein VJK07_01960 [Candidatus Nanoarchaeia archaeon]|nr:hypothetical protein [Candidatus Nanoarchaeia archaeon]
MKTQTNRKGKIKLMGLLAGVTLAAVGIFHMRREFSESPQLAYTANSPILRVGGKDGASRLYNFGSEGLEAVVETYRIIRKDPKGKRNAQVYVQNGQAIVYWSGPMDENNPAMDGFSWNNDFALSPPQKTAMGLYILQHTNTNGKYAPEWKVSTSH